MPSSWTQNYYHMVFGTDRRDPWINAEFKDRLYPFFGGIAKSLRSQLIAGDGMPDHVHLLIRFAADIAPAVLAREVKSRSSGWIHETLPAMHEFAWQRGYGGFTVSRSLVPEVEDYIRRQEEHHRRTTFEQELPMLLTKHGIDFDPDHLFD